MTIALILLQMNDYHLKHILSSKSPPLNSNRLFHYYETNSPPIAHLIPTI